MSINLNIKKIKDVIAKNKVNSESLEIVAVTKYVDDDTMLELYRNGLKNFGENRVDKFLKSKTNLALENVKWHFIGSLQSKKVKLMINEINYLHSLDRLSLAEQIEKHREEVLDCFVQVKTSNEESKHGVAPEQVVEFIKQLEKFSKIRVIGLMVITTNTDDESEIEKEFKKVVSLKEEVKRLYLKHAPCNNLSMGMSKDYEIALQNGADFIRIGSLLYK